MDVRPGRHATRAGAAVGLLALLTVAAPTPTGGTPERARQAAVLPAEVLVPLAVSAGGGVATGPDGTIYVTDAARSGLHAVAADGSSERVAPDELTPSAGVDVAPDGTVVVAEGTGVATFGAEGARTYPNPGGSHTVNAVAATADGQLWALDDETHTIQRLEADGRLVDVYGSGDALRGLAAGPDDALFTIDVDTDDVLRRAADGTVTTIDFTTLVDPRALDVEGERIAVAVNGGVVIREGDGTEAPVPDLAVGNPLDVDLLADGTVLVAYAANPSASAPSVGGLLRKAPGQAVERIEVGGDVMSLEYASIAPTADGGAVFASWSGAPAYSDPNPLRSVAPGRAASDLAVGGQGQAFDTAPDGTLYRTDGRTLWRVPPGGAAEEVALQREPGLDAIVDVAVDEAGTPVVALGSGYGTGGWRVVRVEAGGATSVVAEDLDPQAQLSALGAGGGLVLVGTVDGAGANRLLEVAASGAIRERAALGTAAVWAIEVAVDGDAYVVQSETPQARRRTIVVVAADGTQGELRYEGQSVPVDLAGTPGGDLYVTDENVGVLVLADVLTIEAPAPPTGPPPAVPVPGSATFTG